MEMKCASCGAPMQDGEPHCHMCKASLVCTDEKCACSCGNEVALDEAKCDICLAM